MSEAWYVVQTQPRAEDKASRHLTNQGLTNYLPRYRRRIRHARKSLEVLRPLFPTYIFVQFDPAVCRWRSINGTMGVRHILTEGDIPRGIGADIIEAIREREDEAGAIKLPEPAFSRGQRVRVTEGPLTEIDGIFEEVRDDKRVILLISLLGRKVRMQVPTAAVMAA
jgi:transcriptional antiterminator RfaH